MWSALADGFSEFAAVVSQDAKNVLDSTFMKEISEEDQQDLMKLQRSNNNNGDDDDDDNHEEDSSSSPTRFLSRISQSEFVKDLPHFPSYDKGIKEAWNSQVRELQQDMEKTYLEDLDDGESNLFTPLWLRASSIDDEGVPDDSAERQLFSSGQLLLQNSEVVRNVFTQFFPETANHSIETLQDAIVDEVNETGTKRLLPASFFVRYFVRLNKLFFLMKRQENAMRVMERDEDENQDKSNKNNSSSRKSTSSSNNEAAVKKLTEALSESQALSNKLSRQVSQQQQELNDQESMLKEYKDKSSDLIQEVDRLKAENKEQESLIRQLKLDLERTKLIAKSSSSIDMVSGSSGENSAMNNGSPANSTSPTDASMSQKQHQRDGVKKVVNDSDKEDSNHNQKQTNEGDDDDEEWTEIS